MKAGTATKLELNTITTGAMVLLGNACGKLQAGGFVPRVVEDLS